MTRLKVMVVEDHPLMQTGIKRALEHHDDMQVIGEASTSKRAVEMLDNIQPDIVIMDVKLPDNDGITTMKSIHARFKHTKVLMFSGFDDEHYVVRALESGANGYVLKSVSGNELADAVRQAACGMNPISPQLTSKLLPITRAKTQLCDRLTPREQEVWKLLSNGSSNAEISKVLFVSESTVKFHVRNIFHKLGVKNRVEAAGVAYRSIVA